jgi:hypothetical protein
MSQSEKIKKNQIFTSLYKPDNGIHGKTIIAHSFKRGDMTASIWK